MNARLAQLLEYLERVLDANRQAQIEDLFIRTLNWRSVERLPLVLNYPLPDDPLFQPYPHGQIFDNPDKMLYNELVHTFGTSIACRDRLDDDLPCTIRPNFGTVVIASLFGGRIEQVGDNPPWVRPFDTQEEFKAALERDPLDFTQGWCPRIVERYQYYQEVLSDYPKLCKTIRLVLPDLQGPLDTAELLRGSAIYLDFHTQPDLVAAAMKQVATAQVAFTRHLAKHVNDGPPGFAHQHAAMIRGNVLIRNDSAILIAPKLYRDVVAPRDEFVLHEMGGGGIHACGNVERHVDEWLALPSVRCLDLGQPRMNDVDAIYAKASARKIPLIRVAVAEEEITSGRVMERFPTGVTLAYEAKSLDDARRILDRYKAATEGK